MPQDNDCWKSVELAGLTTVHSRNSSHNFLFVVGGGVVVVAATAAISLSDFVLCLPTAARELFDFDETTGTANTTAAAMMMR